MRKTIFCLLFSSAALLAATNASATWYVHKNGSDNNGGGFDPGLAGAGTSYADQDAARVVFSSGNANLLSAAQNSTTLTSAGSPFTSAMVGNTIQITGGTNLNKNIYWIVGFTDTSNVVLDRAPATAGAGSAGTGNLGGALATLKCLSNGGSAVANPLSTTTQLVAGNQIFLQGSGSANPSTADYDFSAGYWTFASGSSTQIVKLIGYNGRPYIKTANMLAHQVSWWSASNLKMVDWTGANTDHGMPFGYASSNISIDGCIFEQNGKAAVVVSVPQNSQLTNSTVLGGGSPYSFSGTGVKIVGSGALLYGNFIVGVRGDGIWMQAGTNATISNTVVAYPLGSCISVSTSAAQSFIFGNTLDHCAGAGIAFGGLTNLGTFSVFNNIITSSGGYGMDAGGGTAAANQLAIRNLMRPNNLYGNAPNYGSLNAQTGDLSLDPVYAHAAADGTANYTVGAAMQSLAAPGAFAGTATNSYVDLGGVQRQAGSGSGGGVRAYTFVAGLKRSAPREGSDGSSAPLYVAGIAAAAISFSLKKRFY